MMMRFIDTKEYWERRLKSFCNLEGVGCIGLGSFFNLYIYRAKVRTIERMARKFKISFKEKEVLDVGSGIGFWIDYYIRKDARLIYGVDIASSAIKYLKQKYADRVNIELFKGNFADFELKKSFDVVYHVVDDTLFTKFVENLCKHLKVGGFLFITDTFRKIIEHTHT